MSAAMERGGLEPPTTPRLVGRPAPDFVARAYLDGGFDEVTLGSYRGSWVALQFYPGDFTFV